MSFGRALLGSPLFASGERGRDGLASSSSLRDNPDPLGERCTKASWRALLSEPIHERPAPEVEMEVVEPEHHRQDMTDRCRGIPGAGLRPPGTSVHSTGSAEKPRNGGRLYAREVVEDIRSYVLTHVQGSSLDGYADISIKH